MLKIGAQLYTVREYMKNEKDFAETIKRVANIGYKYLQLSGVGKEVSPEHIADVIKTYGVKAMLTHTPVDRIINDTENVIKEHDMYDCGCIGVGSIGPYKFDQADGYKKFAQDIAPALEKIKAAGKLFSYHNHKMEFQRFPDADNKNGFDILFENTDPDVFRLTVDTYWVQDAGCTVSSFIEAYADKIFVTHLKDKTVIENQAVFAEVLTGYIDFPAVFKASLENNIDYHFVELDTTRIDPFESLKISYDNCIASGWFEK